MRWGIAGYGWVARDHMAPGIAAAGGRVAAIADPSLAARAHAEASGIAAFDSVEAMLAAGACDLVYVATPNDAHLAPVSACAAAGVPVLCEKPISASLADAEAMAGAVSAAGTLYGTAFDQRHHPAHRVLANRIAAGDIGRPIGVRVVYACWVDPLWTPDGGAHDNWRADPVRAGGGAVIDLALHGLDLAERVLSEPVEALSIQLQRRIHDYPVDDGGMLMGRTADGVLFQSHVAYNCAEVLPRRRLEVLGEHGMIVATDTMGQTPGGTLTRRCARSGEEQPIAFDAATSPFAAQAAAFMAAARGAHHDFSMTRDLSLMRVFDHAYRKAIACL